MTHEWEKQSVFRAKRLRRVRSVRCLRSIFCIVSWRIFWMTMLNRTAPGAPPNVALTATEMRLLDQLVPDRRASREKKSLSGYIVKIARLGGYLARARDPPPGNIVMWRGLSRLIDIELGAHLGVRIVGN